MPVTVTEQRGDPVLGLTQADFHVYDNGLLQNVIHCELTGGPLDVAFVIERSSHIDTVMHVVHGMATLFAENVIAMDGQGAVISYDGNVDIRQPFTPDHDALERAIKNLSLGSEQMRLFDAMGAAVELLSSQPIGNQRVMLVFGESQDSGSSLKLRDVIRDATVNNITIYAIGPSSAVADLRSGARSGAFNLPLPKSAPPVTTSDPPRDPVGRARIDFATPLLWLFERGSNLSANVRFEHAIKATGGVHYSALRERDILAAFDKIAAEIHARYLISYRPTAERPLAGIHEIRVEVLRRGLAVRARPGYFVDHN